MRRRMLQLLGGAIAVAALAVVPATANADPPTAGVAGNPSCGSDNYSPSSSYGHGFYGNDDDGRYWRGWGDGNGDFGGSSYDSYCNADDRLGRVHHVMVAVSRLSGSQCQHLGSNGRLGPATDCDRPHWTRAVGTDHWNKHIGRQLPSGKYRLHSRAVDTAGNREKSHLLHLRIR